MVRRDSESLDTVQLKEKAMGTILEIEQDGKNRRLVNLSLIDLVQMADHDKTATLWSGGVIIAADSRIAYAYFKAWQDSEKEIIQTGQDR